MNEKSNFRYDPLYRVIDVTQEMRFVEGSFKKLFDRIKCISNLGIIPEVLEMAKYPKYEHYLGTMYQINCLLECVDENTIPDEYHLPLKLSALFLHLGHLPFTYSTERALLLASSLGYDDKDNKAKTHVKKRIVNVLQHINFDNNEQQMHLEKLFSLENYLSLYRYFSANIFLNAWERIKDKFKLINEQKAIIIRNLIDSKNDGYRYLELADQADFVQRDALYFGTVRLDIYPKHLYRQGLLETMHEFPTSVNEKKLLEINLDYLIDRFYHSDRIRWVSRLYEKIVASLILSENFKIGWLDELDDSQFKRLITENSKPDNKPAKLPINWTKRAKNLFDGKISFSPIFKLLNISFEKQNDVVDIEYKLLQKERSIRGLLKYPFEKGVLLDVDYSKEQIFPVHPNYQQFSVSILQNNSQIRFIELLKIIEQLGNYCSIIDIEEIKKISHIRNIREGLCRQFSWTGSIKISNSIVFEAISEAIRNIENGVTYEKGEFINKFLTSVFSIKTFDELWHNIENIYWYSYIDHNIKEHKEHIEGSGIRNYFVEGMLSMPVRLLQYKSTKKYIDEIYKKLLEMIPDAESNEKRGYLFEALCLINRIRERRGKFQFLINGMLVIDPKKPKNERIIHEFDIIELIINENDEAECWIYACSIADDYEHNNKEQLDILASNIHRIYKDLVIRTRYIIPEDKNQANWKPKKEETGVGFGD